MVYAAIDIGTNTIDLLIAKVQGNSLYQLKKEKQWVGIGTDFYPHCSIKEASIKRLLSCLSNYQRCILEFSVESVLCFGTSALRDATNGKEACQLVKEELGMDIQIISGTDEAQIVYSGIRGFENLPEDALIMDIGGGSTEIIHIKQGLIETTESLNIGVTRLRAAIGNIDQLLPQHIHQIERIFEAEWKLGKFNIPCLIGASGAFESFFFLIKQKQIQDNSLAKCSFVDLKKLLNQLIATKKLDREALIGIPEARKEYIHLAALQVKWLIEKLKINTVFITNNNLCEGMIMQAAYFGRLD